MIEVGSCLNLSAANRVLGVVDLFYGLFGEPLVAGQAAKRGPAAPAGGLGFRRWCLWERRCRA